jgi:hypothetical protein
MNLDREDLSMGIPFQRPSSLAKNHPEQELSRLSPDIVHCKTPPKEMHRTRDNNSNRFILLKILIKKH